MAFSRGVHGKINPFIQSFRINGHPNSREFDCLLDEYARLRSHQGYLLFQISQAENKLRRVYGALILI